MGKQVRYTAEFKARTVQMYLQGDLSGNQLALKLGIHPHTIRHWIQDYNDGKMKIPQTSEMKTTNSTDSIATVKTDITKRPDIGIVISKINTLEAEIKELKTIIEVYLFR